MKKLKEFGYNERLFSSGFRAKLHYARYNLLQKWVTELQCSNERVLELGCFDGKAIEFLPSPPRYYLGFDADWENGLAIAEKKWEEHSNYVFKKCTSPDQMDVGNAPFDVAICMETLEHIPPQMVKLYLRKLASSTPEYLFITIPNETGIIFFLKYLMKRVLGDIPNYKFLELLHQGLGNTDKVEWIGHKGFNYKEMIGEIAEHFDIQRVSGYPFTFLPTSLNYGVGIVARKKS